MGIDTYQEPVIYMPAACAVCRSEGWAAQSRVKVTRGKVSIVATLNVVSESLVAVGEAGLSDAAWRILAAEEGQSVGLAHPETLESLSAVRAKVYGRRFSADDIGRIVREIAAYRYSSLELAAFVTASAARGLDLGETVDLTRAMLAVGDRLTWGHTPIVDKHCVGGLPGNRTTMIIVPIIAAAGLLMPKTSSRAITSPAGTADAMETVAPVDLDLPKMRAVVDREGGCIVWGGAAALSPADDIIIRVERPLDLDCEGQLVASVLSKKAAAGSSIVVIDIPVGATAKVRSSEAADRLTDRLQQVGQVIGLDVRVVRTDGRQPVGRGIGPALEAHDVLAVLQRQADAPLDLRDRAVSLAGILLEVGTAASPGTGRKVAEDILADGRAWRKFEAICEAQGGMRKPPVAPYTQAVAARQTGRVIRIDNRRLARLAKLSGAPTAPAAGLEVHCGLEARVVVGEPIVTLHAASRGELEYALSYAHAHTDIIGIE